MTALRRAAPLPLLLLLGVLLATFALTASDNVARAQTPAPTPQTVPHDWALIPDGLGPGDQFRLIFVTSGTRNAASGDIADYNTFVQNAAAADAVDDVINDMSGEFRAVVSTFAVDARDNTVTTGTGVPIHWLGGAKVADSYADFYDDSWDSLQGKSELAGDLRAQVIYTGSDANGTERQFRYAGALSHVRYGSLLLVSPSPLSHGDRPRSETHHLYALSPLLTVDTPPPPLTYEVPNDWALKPSGLGVNDEFRLLIITSTSRDATSRNIIDYNTHVADAVDGGHYDIRAYIREFRALGSTEGVDARDNTVTTGTGVAIYHLNGAKAADDYADFYDGSWDSTEARDEDGDTFTTNPEAWTGSANDGTEYVDGTTSHALGAGGDARYGDIDLAPLSRGNVANTGNRSFYALSPVFKVVDQGAPAVQSVPHDWPLIPSGLSAGSQFRLLFITSLERSAESANIGDYNAFVQGHAGGGHEAIRPYRNGFRVLGSTSAVDANDNTGISGTGVPIYALSVDASGNFNGAKVADDYDDLCDGDLDAAANRDESGAARSNSDVWSGIDSVLTQSCEGRSGQELGASQVRVGASNRITGSATRSSSATLPLYALSPTFEVPVNPGAPDAPTVSDVTDVSARVNWSEPSFTGAYPIFQYQLRIRRCLSSDLDAPCTSWTGGDGWGYVNNFGGAARSALVTSYADDNGTEATDDDEDLNLAPNTRYQVRVNARSRPSGTTDTVYGPWSEGTTFITGPVRPTDLLATPGDTEITLTWQSSETDAAALTHFTVEYADNAAFTSPQSADTASSDPDAGTLAPTELTVTGLTNGVGYHFRVRAARGTAASRWSGAVTATPAPATDYDADNDGLIDVGRLGQLNGIRYDLDGDGAVTDDTGTADFDEAHAYLIAFPNPVDGMGCPAGGCTGYELVADLDFDENGNSARDDTYNTGAGWDPIGDSTNSFAAIFDGNDHAISNLFINRPSATRVALFHGFESGSVLRGLGLVGVDVTGNGDVGGLAGANFGAITASYVTGSVSAGSLDNVGGLVGVNYNLVSASYSAASVSGNSSALVGGLVGRNADTGEVLASYSTGVLNGTGVGVGGLVGESAGTITASYSTGNVTATGTNVGGLVGVNTGTVTASYWDTVRSEQSTSAGGTAKTGAELRTPTGYTGIYSAWNLDLDGDSAADDPWDFGADYNYPTLRDAGGRQKGPGPVSGLTAAPHDGGNVLVVTWSASTVAGDGTLNGDYRGRYHDGRVWYSFARSATDTDSEGNLLGTTYNISSPRDAAYRIEVWAVREGAAHTEGRRAAIGLPGPPRMVSLTSFDQRIDVSWTAPADTGGSDITHYRLVWRQQGAADWTTLTLPATPTSRSFTGLDAGGTYEFRIAATNADGTGPYTQPLSAVASDVVDYDTDDDGLIEIRTLAQLNAVRWDTDGNGMVTDNANTDDRDEAAIYAAAFPQAATGMGCPPGGCTGYELMASLDFDIDGNGVVDENDGRTDTNGDGDLNSDDDLDVDADGDENVDGGAFWNGGAGFRPIGTGSDRFVATFDGNNNTIANLFIDRGPTQDNWDRVGLFGRLGDDGSPAVGATVRNLVITGASVTADDRVGILTGQTYGPTVISDVRVSGSVTAAGNDYAGGLVAATHEDTTIINSSAAGSVTSDDYAGGLVGNNKGTIAASYSSASVTGGNGESTGGLVGRNQDSGSTILASYATGAVTGDANVGGLVGDNEGDITASYSTGAPSGSSGVGGLVGLNSGAVTNSYWDTESSGQSSSDGGTGKTGTELRAPTGYTGIYANWNLDLDNADGDDSHVTGQDNPWDFGASYNYPTLRNAPGKQKGPGPVEDITAKLNSGTTVVSWDAPSDRGEGTITGYEYRHSTDGGANYTAWASATGRSYDFSLGLLSSNIVEARAVTDAAHSRGAARSIEPPQNAPQNLELIAYTVMLQADWEAPADDGGPDVIAYWVNYRPGTTGNWNALAQSFSDTTAVIQGLTNGQAYQVRVAAGSAMGLGVYSDPVSGTPTADTRLPGAPTGLTLTPGDQRLTASWTAPRDLGNPPLTGYEVEYREVTVPESAWRTWLHTGDGTTATITGLTSDGPFEVQVAAVNAQGDGTYAQADPIDLVRPPGAPRYLGLYPKDRSIEVTWSAPADLGLPPLHAYIVEYRQRTDRAWKNWPHSGTDGPSNEKYGRQRTEITGLTNGEEYLVRVAAVNREGSGENEPERNGEYLKGSATPFNPADLPGVPGNLRVYPSDSRLDVRWEAPDDLGDPELTHYLVSIPRTGIPRTVDAPATATVFKDRVNGRSYQVSVAACNRWGCGPSTPPVTATPLEGQERPDIERPPTAPMDMTLTPGDGEIVVTWKAPADAGKPADGTYLVEYRKAGTSNDWTGKETDRLTYTLMDLTNGQAYEVQVTAYNDHGGGVAGPQSVAPAAPGKGDDGSGNEGEGERPPSAPRNLSLTAGDGWIKVSWDEPTDLGDPAAEYIVETRVVGAAGSGGWFEEGPYKGATATISATNGQSYQVRVVAFNQHGEATVGPHTARPTAPEPDEERPPTAPRNLTLTPGDGIIEVSWTAPFDKGEEDAWLGYIVEVRERGESSWFEWGVQKGASATIDSLDNGKTYQVRVSAFNKYGQATAGPKRAILATGKLVVVPQSVERGQTTEAVGFHVEPRDLEVKIEYSGHFIPEGESCDDAGTSGTTQSAVAPTWITLKACTVGETVILLVAADTGAVIEKVSVTVIEPSPASGRGGSGSSGSGGAGSGGSSSSRGQVEPTPTPTPKPEPQPAPQPAPERETPPEAPPETTQETRNDDEHEDDDQGECSTYEECEAEEDEYDDYEEGCEPWLPWRPWYC